ncbi:hypothetical protein H9P43_008893 [Blastocladiella emersonii ATCC 22665]|nr:hypothetical protein H9P43_008893 [Blastocladiella emersonii ATCC 22665]
MAGELVVELVKFGGIAMCLCMTGLLIYMFRPRRVTIEDPETGEDRTIVTTGPMLSLMDVYARQDQEQAAANARAEAMLREAMAQRGCRFEEDAIDPLPPYTLYGGDADVHLDLESRIAVIIDQLESGGIVISSTRPVLASAGNPILPSAAGTPANSVPSSPTLPAHNHSLLGRARNHAPHHHRGHSRQPSRVLSPTTETAVDPVLPNVVPNDPLPVVRLTLSLPPPPRYAKDLVGVQLEASALLNNADGASASSSTTTNTSPAMVPQAPPCSPVTSPRHSLELELPAPAMTIERPVTPSPVDESVVAVAAC